MAQAVSRRRLIAGAPVNRRPVHVGFVVGIELLGKVSFLLLRFSPVSIISPGHPLPTPYICS